MQVHKQASFSPYVFKFLHVLVLNEAAEPYVSSKVL